MLPKLKNYKGLFFMGKLSMELYLKNLSKRYRTAGKREKGMILQELCESSGYHKNTLFDCLMLRPRSPNVK